MKLYKQQYFIVVVDKDDYIVDIYNTVSELLDFFNEMTYASLMCQVGRVFKKERDSIYNKKERYTLEFIDKKYMEEAE